MYRYILFDLDGTLTDPKEGICKSVQAALEAYGISEKNIDRLEHFIGPPLKESFMKTYGFSEEKAKEAIGLFRKRFGQVGVYENEIYPGISELLADLKKNGAKLCIASSKPKIFVDIVLKHFHIEEFFEVVVGSAQDGKRDSKIEMIREALELCFDKKEEEDETSFLARIPKDEIIMIGDREFDILGAAHFGLNSIGVTYGYAPAGELSTAGKKAGVPVMIADSVEELRDLLLRESPYRFSRRQTAFRNRKAYVKAADILLPVPLFFLVINIVAGILYYVMSYFQIFELPSGGTDEVFTILGGIATALASPVLYWYYQKSTEKEISYVVRRSRRQKLLVNIPVIAACAMGLSLFFNGLFVLTGFTGLSERFQETAQVQFSVPLLTGILIYGLVTPFAEELLFRGIVYNRMKRYMGVPMAIAGSALLFGIFHGNLVQGVYAFFLGLAMGLVYEKFRHLLAPVVFHCIANIITCFLVYDATGTERIRTLLYSPLGCLAAAMVSVITVCFIIKLRKD